MTRAIAALFAGTAIFVAAPAIAADLVEPVPVAPVAEPIYEPSAFDWTGFYVGAQAAYGWGEYDFDSPIGGGSRDADGFYGGLYAGYNQAVTPNWIVGGEADFLWGEDHDYRVAGVGVDSSSPVISTLRARVGYAFDSFMVYGTGGLAIGFLEAEALGESDSNTHLGWTVGAGVEAALTENITARAEYLYVDTESKSYDVGGTSADLDLDTSLVRVGVGYKF